MTTTFSPFWLLVLLSGPLFSSLRYLCRGDAAGPSGLGGWTAPVGQLGVGRGPRSSCWGSLASVLDFFLPPLPFTLDVFWALQSFWNRGLCVDLMAL